MKNKILFEQLKSLKDIKPDSKWREENRGLLMNQIYSASPTVDASFSWGNTLRIKLPLQLMKTLAQPTMAVIFLVVFFLGGGFVSLKVAKSTKPGDSLYVAKIISEKTQLALTFNEKKKAQLGIGFASNRAKELGEVIEGDEEMEEERVVKLVDDFKKEISTVKLRLEKLNKTNIESEEEVDNSEEIEEVIIEEEGQMFVANTEKQEEGIDIGQVEEVIEEVEEEASTTEEMVGEVATSTENVDVVEEESTNAESILIEAGVLLDGDNIEATLLKLLEAGNIIENIDKGEVKGAEESATSSVEIEVEATEETASTTN